MRTGTLGRARDGVVGRVVPVAAAALLLAAGAALPSCTQNVATGKNILTLGMSRQMQISLGNQAAPQFREEMGGAVPNPQIQSYIDGIGRKMAAFTEGDNPSLPWEFTFLNTSQINAFALPGGKVFFTRGLAEQLTTEAQMAGIIGHEIGHVTAEHGAQRIAKHTAFNIGMVATAVVVGVAGDKQTRDIAAVGVPALAIGGNLVLMKFGREEELEADRLGVRYMAKAGYNPRGQMEVMQVLARLSQGQRQPEFLSTHPDPNARVEQVQRLLQGEYASTQNNPQYQDFADRYKTQFLDVIKTLPPAPAPKQSARWISVEEAIAMGADPRLLGGGGTFDLNDPTSWCAHCRLAALEAEAAECAGGRAAEVQGARGAASGMLATAVMGR